MLLSEGTVPGALAGAALRDRTADGRLTLDGRWTADQGPAVEAAAAGIAAAGRAGPVAVDLSAIERLDTLGAWVLERTRAEIEQAGAPSPISTHGRSTAPFWGRFACASRTRRRPGGTARSSACSMPPGARRCRAAMNS